jgi:hypothetical protein
MDPRTFRDSTNEQLRASIEDAERQLKELSPKLAEHEIHATSLRAEISRQTQQINTIKNELDRRNRPAPVPRISDHALLRYIERVHGVNIDQLRETILSPNIVKAIQAGAGAVIVQGIKLIVNGFTIVTVLGEDQRVKRKDAKHGRMVEAQNEGSAIAAGLLDYEQDRADSVQADARA